MERVMGAWRAHKLTNQIAKLIALADGTTFAAEEQTARDLAAALLAKLEDGTVGEKFLLSIPEAAQILDLSPTTIYELLNERRIRSVNVRTSRKISRDEIRRFISELPSTLPSESRPVVPRRVETERKEAVAEETKPVKRAARSVVGAMAPHIVPREKRVLRKMPR
jgi:excisionase family DNA binding protein